MFIIIWLLTMLFVTIFGLFAIVVAALLRISNVLGISKGQEIGEWIPKSLRDDRFLTLFKEFFIGGSVQP
jgi:hypothetical protein